MSRIGRKPLEIPKGVQVSITKDTVSVKGPKGTLNAQAPQGGRDQAGQGRGQKDVLVFERKGNLGPSAPRTASCARSSTTCSTGVTKGFTRQLEINGVGYKAEIKGPKIMLSLGFSHPIEYTLPEGITAKTDKNLLILVGHRQPGARRRGGEDPQLPSARAVQGQGHQVRRRDDPPQGRQDGR